MAEEVGKSSSVGATTSSRKPSSKDFDVFLSFFGPDSRYTVVPALYNALFHVGVRVFYDDEDMKKGEEIGGEMMKAIDNSAIYIPIFSRNYASSRRCLRELAEIMKYFIRDDKTIFPVFYDVDPSDVRLKTEVYTTALQEHKKGLGEDVVQPWEKALREVTSMKGFIVRNHGLTEHMESIVEEVCYKLWSKSEQKKVPDSDDYVGIYDPMNYIMKLLDLGADDVRFVVIHGIAGVGKTTLARLVFNEISSNFHQGVAFLLDICEKSRAAGIAKLQKDLISQLLKENSFDFSESDEGVNTIKESLKDKKVLIVLDDIDKRDQLLKLAGQPSWFCMGSRIVITTRNIGIMPEGEGCYRYEMQKMKFDDALKLFCRRVFESDSPPKKYDEISKEVVRTTGELPLTINAIAIPFRNKYARKVTFGKLMKEVHEDETEATTTRTPSSANFDVYLNFQGSDSRSTIVDVLYYALVHAGVRVLYDNDSIGQGGVIAEELMEAITNTKIYIPIFSKNYASSEWCLRELTEIMECWKASKVKKTILPIFFDVDPSDVGLKTEVYTTALREHKKRSGKDVVEQWETVLKEVAKMKGWDIRDHGLHVLAELVVEEVRLKLGTGSDLEKVTDDKGK